MKLFASALALAGLLVSVASLAQVNEKFADLADEIALVRSMAQTQRTAAVGQHLVLTAEQGQAFWPLYNQYRTDVAAAQDKRIKLITDYAARYETLSDADARKLLDGYLDYQNDALKVRRKYVSRFAKVLPGTKLARLFQIENKLDAVADLAIASQIPLSK